MTKKSKNNQVLKQENQLARVASRGELYQESLLHNFGRHVSEESCARMFAAIFNLCVVYCTDFVEETAKMLEPSFQFMPDVRQISRNRLSNNDIFQYAINLTIFYYIFITLFVTFKRYNILDFLHRPVDPHDAFNQNLSEKKCLESIDQLFDQKKNLLLETSIAHGIYLACLALPLSYSPSSSIKTAIVGMTSSQMFKVMDQFKKLVMYIKDYCTFPSQNRLCNIINFILEDTGISFKVSDCRKTSLIFSNSVSNIFMLGVSSDFKNYISLDMNVDKMDNSFAKEEYRVRYYIVLMVKQIVEQCLGYKVMALDDSSLIINADKKLDCDPFVTMQRKKQAKDKISHLILMMDLSDKYIRVFNQITENNTFKTWNKLFDISNKSLFSFSLNIERINCDVQDIIANIHLIFADLKLCIYGGKLIVEGELNKIKRGQAARIFNLKNEIKFSTHVKVLAKNQSLFLMQNKPQPNVLDMQNSSVVQAKTVKYKNKLPKIHGRKHFLFSCLKKPELVGIEWNRFKNYSPSQSPYYPLFHGCSNKTIFYSAFTLEETDFTLQETKHMFLNILKSGIVRTGNTLGSCIKLVTHAERMSLKSKILNWVKDPDRILFKLHTGGDSRVYGILQDEGIATYDDGSKIKVKMIEWCIVDQTSHKDTSHNIYCSIKSLDFTLFHPGY